MQRFQEPSLFLALLLIISSATPATAQVIVDATLPGENSIVTRLSTGTGTHFVITGGATRSTSLFHSFSHFDLSNGDLATFQNGLEIANIFARVTGGQVSSIDGLITANGLANLFVINPNGILLGPNAQLNIGGSFLASTADSVQFQHGLFSAVEPNVPPLLTIDIPLGLQMGENPGAIEVQGRGHALSTNDLFVQVFERGIPPSRLQVNSGQAIVLLGGDVLLDGGVLLAEEGHIDLGSVSSDFVYLTIAPPNPGLRLNYRDVDTFQDIRLINQALVDVSAPIFLLGGFRGDPFRLRADGLIWWMAQCCWGKMGGCSHQGQLL